MEGGSGGPGRGWQMLPAGGRGWISSVLWSQLSTAGWGQGGSFCRRCLLPLFFPHLGCTVPQSLWSHPCSVPSQGPSVSLHCGSRHRGRTHLPAPPTVSRPPEGPHLADWSPHSLRPGGGRFWALWGRVWAPPSCAIPCPLSILSFTEALPSTTATGCRLLSTLAPTTLSPPHKQRPGSAYACPGDRG